MAEPSSERIKSSSLRKRKVRLLCVTEITEDVRNKEDAFVDLFRQHFDD
jgi:hypothetical protein